MEVFYRIVVIAAIIYFIRWKIKRRKDRKAFEQMVIVNTPSTTKVKRPLSLERRLYQALETVKLVFESNKVETVKSRLEFLHELLLELDQNSSSSGYHSTLSRVEEKYKEDYYDRHITFQERLVLLKPSEYLTRWEEFSDDMIIKAFKRYAKKQEDHIKNLKTSKAKQNRMSLIIDESITLKKSIIFAKPKEEMDVVIEQLQHLKSTL